MTARFSARLTFSFLLMAIGFFVLLLLSASPAQAHHREGHTTGNAPAATTDTSTEESTEGSGTSGTDEGTTAAATSSDTTIETPSGSVSGEAKTKSSSTSTDSSSSTSGSTGKGGANSGTGQDEDKAAVGVAKHGSDPDPVQTQSPPATKGPTTCPDYDDGDAGAYDHDNCDGSQGLMGNGGNGKCAGCTGKADDKAPPGQYPGDNNNGYECDNNSGIGKGNPAHSRCAAPAPVAPPPPPPPPPPPGPCVDNMTTPEDECNPPQPCVDNPKTPKDECNPEPKPPKDDDKVLGTITPILPPDELQPRPPGQPVLPRTGATTGTFLWLALLMMGAGALLLWRTGNRNGANA